MGPRPRARTRGGRTGEANGVGAMGTSDGCEAIELAWESSKRLTGDGARGSEGGPEAEAGPASRGYVGEGKCIAEGLRGRRAGSRGGDPLSKRPMRSAEDGAKGSKEGPEAEGPARRGREGGGEVPEGLRGRLAGSCDGAPPPSPRVGATKTCCTNQPSRRIQSWGM